MKNNKKRAIILLIFCLLSCYHKNLACPEGGEDSCPEKEDCIRSDPTLISNNANPDYPTGEGECTGPVQYDYIPDDPQCPMPPGSACENGKGKYSYYLTGVWVKKCKQFKVTYSPQDPTKPAATCEPTVCFYYEDSGEKDCHISDPDQMVELTFEECVPTCD